MHETQLFDSKIFFKIKFSKFIQAIRTLESFGKFLLIVYTLDTYQEKNTTFLNSQIEPEFALDFLQSLYNVDFAGKP